MILFSIFFADWLSALGLIPVAFTWLPDIALIILTSKVLILKFRKYHFARTTLDFPILVFIVWGVISLLINGGSFIDMILSLRQLLKFGLMFFMIVYLDFGKDFFRKMLIVLLVLFIIQVPTALVKMMIYGQGEHAIGTYAFFGGGLSAILPLFVLSVMLGLYFYESSKWRYLVFLGYFQLFYYACPKRAYPMFAFVILPFLLLLSGKQSWKKLLPLSPVVAVFLAMLLYVSPDLRSALDSPGNVVSWATSYTYQKDDEVTSGRVAVVEFVFKMLKEKPIHLLVGLGPGTMTEKLDNPEGGFKEDLPIYYGLTEFSTMSIEYGYGGVLIFLWMLFRLFKALKIRFKNTHDPFWKAMAFSSLGIWFTCLLTYFYSAVFRMDVSAFLFWFFAAMIHNLSRHEEESKAAVKVKA
jgi:hypothetical protein